MKFGSWTNDQSRIDLIMIGNQSNQASYWESGEWEILDSGFKIRWIFFGADRSGGAVFEKISGAVLLSLRSGAERWSVNLPLFWFFCYFLVIFRENLLNRVSQRYCSRTSSKVFRHVFDNFVTRLAGRAVSWPKISIPKLATAWNWSRNRPTTTRTRSESKKLPGAVERSIKK